MTKCDPTKLCPFGPAVSERSLRSLNQKRLVTSLGDAVKNEWFEVWRYLSLLISFAGMLEAIRQHPTRYTHVPPTYTLETQNGPGCFYFLHSARHIVTQHPIFTGELPDPPSGAENKMHSVRGESGSANQCARSYREINFRYFSPPICLTLLPC